MTTILSVLVGVAVGICAAALFHALMGCVELAVECWRRAKGKS